MKTRLKLDRELLARLDRLDDLVTQIETDTRAPYRVRDLCSLLRDELQRVLGEHDFGHGDRYWVGVVQRVAAQNCLLGAMLRNCARRDGPADGVLRVMCTTSFVQQTVDKPANRRLVENAVAAEFGQHFRLEIANEGAPRA
jgi:hypothetical protein